jgi:hypothetical protein
MSEVPMSFRPDEATVQAILYLQALHPGVQRQAFIRHAIIQLAIYNGWDGDPVFGSDIRPQIWPHGR